MATIIITVYTTKESGPEYKIPIYQIEVDDGKGVWTEVYGSLAEVTAFLQGTKAAGLGKPILGPSEVVTLTGSDRRVICRMAIGEKMYLETVTLVGEPADERSPEG